MRALLTGATGFVGGHVLAELLRRGHSVRCLIRPRSRPALEDMVRAEDRERLEVVPGDVAADNGVGEDAAAGCDAIVHLVGIIRAFPRRGVTFRGVHVGGTEAMIGAAQRAGISRFLLMSAQGTRPDAATEYHRTKWEAEQSLRASEMRWTIFRPSVILGAGGEFLEKILVQLVRPRIAPALAWGRPRFQPIGAPDLARGIVNALERPQTEGRVYEVGGRQILTLAEMLRTAARARGHGVLLIPTPVALIWPLAWLLDRFAFFPVTRDQLTMMREESLCEDPEPFWRECGVDPAPIADVIREAVSASRPTRRGAA
ncbi:NAD(P)H-binding protein [Candidatus Sumerlaeota bacterium]|nr:NAD(P)H-binding protein [Candidatus Sumerlaeota bacterium]